MEACGESVLTPFGEIIYIQYILFSQKYFIEQEIIEKKILLTLNL